MNKTDLGKWDWIVLIFCMIFPTLSAWLYFDVFNNTNLVPKLYGFSKVIQFAIPVIWVLWVRGEKIRFASAPDSESQRKSSIGSCIGSGAIMGLCIVAALMALYFGYFNGSVYLEEMPDRLKAKLEDFQLTTPLKFIGMALFLSLLHSFLEEYYWRWYVFGQLRKNWSYHLAAVVSGLGFMAHHVIIVNNFMRPEHFWFPTLFFSLCIAVGGYLWAWLYQRSQSLIGPWVNHLFVDLGIMTVGYHQIFIISAD